MGGSPRGTPGIRGTAAVGGGAGKESPLGPVLLPVLCLPSLPLPPALSPWKGTLGDGLRALLAPPFQLVWPMRGRHWPEMWKEGDGGEWLFPGSLPLGPLRVLASVPQPPSQSLWQVLESLPFPQPSGRLESSTSFSTFSPRLCKWPLYEPYPNHPV